MNNDLIKRSDAIKAFCNDCKHQDTPCEHQGTCMTMAVLLNKSKLPSVKRPKGKWIEKYVEDADAWSRRRFYCSVCGQWQTYGKTKFCPKCGSLNTR